MSHKQTLDKYRHINVDYDDWYLPLYESFIEKLDTLGIDTVKEDINFSGFWSQGDGASFSGYIHRDNMQKFMDEHALATLYPACYYFAKLKELGARLIRTASRYSHENTIRADLDMDYIDENQFDDDDARKEIYSAMVVQFNNEYQEFEEKVQTICRGWMKHLYRALEEEYENLTSDEAVMDTVEANDLLTEEGEEDGLCCDQR